MSKNIEKQGKRPGYIVGGIFALIVGALLVILYLPSLISAIAGIDPIWDLYSTFEGILGANFMEMFVVWGGAGLLLLLGGVYFICLFARPSAASTMFRLSALFGVLSLMVPNLLLAISATIEDASGTVVDLMQYSTYAVFGLFVLSFIFYVIGFVVRFKQKYHKNRASTVLVFAATFWMLLAAFPALNALNTFMDANVYFFVDAGTLVSANYLGFISVFLVVSAIWMFITFPHRVVVDYNPDTKGARVDGRPQVLASDPNARSAPFNAPEAAKTAAPAQANGQPAPRFDHNYTQAPAMPNMAPNSPAFNNPTMAQPAPNGMGQAAPNNMGQNAFAANPIINQGRPVVQPAQFTSPTPRPVMQQPEPIEIRPRQPAPKSPFPPKNANPYASFNNFTQNSPYNKQPTPQAPRPQPQPFPQSPMGQGARPVMQPQAPRPQMPRPNAFNQPQQPQQPRPAQFNQPQQPRPNPFSQPQNPAPRPPVTPFTTPNTPPKPNGQNNGSGTPPANN